MVSWCGRPCEGSSYSSYLKIRVSFSSIRRSATEEPLLRTPSKNLAVLNSLVTRFRFVSNRVALSLFLTRRNVSTRAAAVPYGIASLVARFLPFHLHLSDHRQFASHCLEHCQRHTFKFRGKSEAFLSRYRPPLDWDARVRPGRAARHPSLQSIPARRLRQAHAYEQI